MHDVRTHAIARRAVRGVCFEFCRDLGRFRCVRAISLAVVCGALHAAVVVAIEVARGAIAPMSVRVAGGHRRARTRGPGVMLGIVDPLVMCGLPRMGTGATLERLRPVLQACYDRFTFI